MSHFILNGTINSRTDLGLRITQPPTIPPAKRIIQSIDVDGREGSLTILKGWEDVKFSVGVALVGTDIQARWREVLPQIMAASTISFSTDPSVFFNVKRVEAGGLERRLTRMWEFSLSFTCAPFRYLSDVATITLTANGTLANPGSVYSLPKIKVYGTGSRTLTINGKPITLNLLNGNLTVDSDLKECHFGSVAQNQNMTGDFPVFTVGTNIITLGSGITRVEIEPRWRYL
jgi:phage-related protein